MMRFCQTYGLRGSLDLRVKLIQGQECLKQIPQTPDVQGNRKWFVIQNPYVFLSEFQIINYVSEGTDLLA